MNMGKKLGPKERNFGIPIRLQFHTDLLTDSLRIGICQLGLLVQLCSVDSESKVSDEHARPRCCTVMFLFCLGTWSATPGLTRKVQASKAPTIYLKSQIFHTLWQINT